MPHNIAISLQGWTH